MAKKFSQATIKADSDFSDPTIVYLMGVEASGTPAAFRTLASEALKTATKSNIATLTLGASADVVLNRDSNDILAQRRSSNPQLLRLYELYISGSDHSRAVFGFRDSAGNTMGTPALRIGTEHAGLGVARAVSIVTGGVERINFPAVGHPFLPAGQSLSFSGAPAADPLIYASGNQLCLRAGSNGVQLQSASGVDGGNLNFKGHASIVSASGAILGITNGSTGGGALEFTEMTAPATPAADKARIFARDNGSGKTQVCIILPDGVVTVLATQT